MKSEAEIRAHLTDLHTALVMPCDCLAGGNPQHMQSCRDGVKAIKGQIVVLHWLLGEADEYDETVKGLSEMIRHNLAVLRRRRKT